MLGDLGLLFPGLSGGMGDCGVCGQSGGCWAWQKLARGWEAVGAGGWGSGCSSSGKGILSCSVTLEKTENSFLRLGPFLIKQPPGRKSEPFLGLGPFLVGQPPKKRGTIIGATEQLRIGCLGVSLVEVGLGEQQIKYFSS